MTSICVIINKKVDGHSPGDRVTVEVDENGTPLERQWRRRLKDAEFDNCCEIFTEKPAKRAKKEESK